MNKAVQFKEQPLSKIDRQDLFWVVGTNQRENALTLVNYLNRNSVSIGFYLHNRTCPEFALRVAGRTPDILVFGNKLASEAQSSESSPPAFLWSPPIAIAVAPNELPKVSLYGR